MAQWEGGLACDQRTTIIPGAAVGKTSVQILLANLVSLNLDPWLIGLV